MSNDTISTAQGLAKPEEHSGVCGTPSQSHIVLDPNFATEHF